MSGLKQLRSRIKNIKSTKKITKAMQFVAASKLKKARECIVASEHYLDSIMSVMQAIACDENFIKSLKQERVFFYRRCVKSAFVYYIYF